MNQTPVVKLILVCESVVFDMKSERRELSDPLGVAMLPEGSGFPFRADELWVYTQLVDGEGPFRLSVRMRQQLNDGTYKTIGTSDAAVVTFDQNRLVAKPVVFRLKRVPFQAEGIFEFRVIAHTEHELVALGGQVAQITMLDRRTRL